MAKASSILSKKSVSKVPITFKADATLKERSDKLQKIIAEKFPDAEFNVPRILENALRSAVEKGEKEVAQAK